MEAPNNAALAEFVPPELRRVVNQADAPVKPVVLEVGAAPARRGLVALNRKQRRAQEKQRRSKTFQKAQAKNMDNIRRQMQAQLDAQKLDEELMDVPFADPRHIGKISKVFDPVVAHLQSIVTTGEVTTMEDGTPLMWSGEDGCWYPAGLALQSVVETYEKLGRTFGWNDHSDGLRVIANHLTAQEPITQDEVDAAMKSIEWMKFCTLTITPRQFSVEAQEVQIKNELEDQGLLS